jgi:hypothetical protein
MIKNYHKKENEIRKSQQINNLELYMMKNYKTNAKRVGISIWMFMFFSWQLLAQTVTFSFANAKMTDGSGGAGTTHYEVDVMLTTDTDFKLGIGQIYIDYNTAAFGTSIAGGNLTTNHPAGSETGYILDTRVFGGFANFYNALNVVDNTTSKVSIDWNQAQTASNLPAANVTSAGSPTLLIHLTIQYIDNTQDPGITFDAVLSDNLSNTAGDGALGTGSPSVNITNDSYDSSGAKLANTWTGTTDTDWDTTTNWSLGSVPTGTSTVIIADVANAPVASGAISVDEMTLNAGSKLTVNGAVTNNSTMIINSGASLIAQTSVSGNITYNRTLGTTNWYLTSAPVSGETMEDLISNHTFAAGSGGGRIGIAPYLNDGTGWDYQTSGSTGSLVAGKGYSVKLDATGDISFTGTMPVSDVSIEITDGTANEFNLIGNPYPSFLALNDLADGTNNLLRANGTNGGNNDGNIVLSEDTIWFWDQSLNAGAGAYNQANLASSRFIAPGQGFFVKRTTDVGTLNFNFRENMQSHQTDNFQRNANTRPEIKLSITDGTEIKETTIFYISGTTTSWDNGYDSSVFGAGDHSFSIYTQLVSDNTNKDLAIQSLPDNGYQTMVIPVGVNATAGTTITISAASLHLPNGIQVYLEDKDQGTFTLLDATSNFTTTLSESLEDIGRFYLHTTTSALSIGTHDLSNVSVFLPTENTLRIVGVQSGDVEISIYDILGKKAFQTTFVGNGINDIQLPNLRSSIYIVKMVTQQGKLNKKIIIE